MIDINEYFLIEKATMTLSYNEIECLVAFIKNFENGEIPETIREEILPKLCDFLIENL